MISCSMVPLSTFEGLSEQIAAIKPTSMWLEFVLSIIVMGHLKLELDGDNKDPGGYL